MVVKKAIHKRHLLRGGGREGGQKLPILLSKKTIKGEGGSHKIGKMGRRRLWMAPNGKPLSLGKVETKKVEVTKNRKNCFASKTRHFRLFTDFFFNEKVYDNSKL